ncbi:helix-turn-helix domain-containing protein [Methylophilus sp. 5]|uniref:helix-turn-helix domain-containing protein n=1 Tax=Methylophilus sp. 5 TaxID=1112274 RepID=UPI00048F9656|nr:helix-turn-helix transcriptional regulator [Methylophilus sp. 5]
MSKKTNSLASTHPEVLQALDKLGLRLRANRVALGWTVKEMATRLLCSQNTYRAIEAGKPSASVGIIANALWLFGQLDSFDAIAPVPINASANTRARKKSGTTDAALISEAERDF